jgi:Tol biopolymer transport system component
MVWVDRSGTEQPFPAPARLYANPRLSPDGRKLAVGIEGEGSASQIWICDLPACTLTRFTPLGAANVDNDLPVWNADASRLAFASNFQGPQRIFWQTVGAPWAPERLTDISSLGEQPRSWSSNGQLLAFTHTANPATRGDIYLLRIADREEFPFLMTPAHEGGARFSPTSPILAYVSSESGRMEVYVQEVAGLALKRQVSMGGGVEPLWNPNGRELFYRNGTRMMAVDVTAMPALSVGQPRLLFDRRYRMTVPPNLGSTYDVTPDGQRFLMINAQPAGPS